MRRAVVAACLLLAGLLAGVPSPRAAAVDLHGFWEARGGYRTRGDGDEKSASIMETRLQLDAAKDFAYGTVRVRSDFLYDGVLDRHGVDLEEGSGWIDLREANVLLYPSDFMDLKVGRQILTWGTGDLIFINDLFPKDWKSFFIGRDDEYLKAPSDAAKASIFLDLFNLDLVYTPRFDADRFISGERISYWNDGLGRLAGRDAVVRADQPDDWFRDAEFAGRLYRTIRGYEAALYGYAGYWKSPGGQDPVTGKATYPRLSVYGASLRGTALGGIVSLEAGYYDSREDRNGRDPFVRNGEVRYLAGYERELARDFTAAVQFYVEHMLDYSAYRRSLPPTFHPRERNRQVLTLRLTQLLLNQNLKLSFFAFYSPTDDDAYLRPKAHYKFTDNWSGEIGANVFLGRSDYTFFGQFRRNSNLYLAVRYGF
ncbi:hypothetical protein G3N55_01760 [Dissulfurirhabdus thermomarina]|uniref:DUF1302 domain-containing protein n=1 Tax=Dissulfurirhabdus thermomarina TaxID=1765737 RepID=A0A6N9TKH9_DISTH|nr:hypothetical protein [Dissulfurirhabdus thermomarina]NDY41578.1 hypothetical protein [Dissulfurirhabdus thermomarina]NMX22367.1 hypothetical protein [Dissulfurirhabdus thermomarina]